MADEFVPTKYSMSDEGTRMDHLSHVRALWADALASLEARFQTYLSERDKVLIVKLRNAIELLDEHIEKDYVAWKMAREINGIPPADSIEGGRGTKLKKHKE
jgi:hypothetical protein